MDRSGVFDYYFATNGPSVRTAHALSCRSNSPRQGAPVAMATKRSPITTESPEELRSLAAEVSQLASALADLRARAESFSKPVYDAGWKFPIASMLAFSGDLQGWAEAIETIADAGETPAS